MPEAYNLRSSVAVKAGKMDKRLKECIGVLTAHHVLI